MTAPDPAPTLAATSPHAARAWWAPAVALAAAGWGANQFAPLLVLYRDTAQLSPLGADAAFALYAAGLVPALLVGGRLSERVGRRRVVVPALALSLLSALLLAAGGMLGSGWLFAGRLVAGVAAGAAFSAGVVWLQELGPPDAGPRRATVATTTGFAGGPLCSGLLAQCAPAPAVTAYVPHALLAVVALAATLRAPDRVGPGARRPSWIAAARDARFRSVVLPLAPWVFGSAALALAYLPSLVAHRTGGLALLFAAGATSLAAAAGIAVQPLARRAADAHRPRRLLVTAMGLVLAGLVVAALAAATISVAIALVAVAVLGAAYGATQVCGLTEIRRLAAPEHLAGMTALYQAVSYSGFALPFVLTAAGSLASPVVLLTGVALVAGLTLVVVTRSPTDQEQP